MDVEFGWAERMRDAESDGRHRDALTDRKNHDAFRRCAYEGVPWPRPPVGPSSADAVHRLGIEQVVTAPRPPWQNPYVERFNGSARRECFDHVIVLGERHARRILRSYVEYYEQSRTHLGLFKDTPVSRPIASPAAGEIVAIPQVGGLHHLYGRRAA